jgi:hypothetical protein
MEVLRVSNLDQLVDYSLLLHNDYEVVKRIELSDDFNFRIVIKGNTWDGKFDQRVAEIVTSMYNLVIRLYSETEEISLRTAKKRLKKVRVVAVIEDGSLKLLLEILDSLKAGLVKALEKMEPKHVITAIALVCSTILASQGVDVFKQRNEELLQIRLREVDAQERIKIIEASNKAIEDVARDFKIVHYAAKPMQTIANQLAEEDTVYLPNTDKTYSSEEYKKSLPVSYDVMLEEQKVIYLDDSYRVLEWSNYEKQLVVLEKDGMKIKNVELLLDDADQATFVGVHVGSREPIVLNVTAKVQNDKIISSQIIGVGAARQNSIKLETLFND